jgi:hypothetical protein
MILLLSVNRFQVHTTVAKLAGARVIAIDELRPRRN